MAFPTYQFQGYPAYYPQPVPDQLAQLRQQQTMPMQQMVPPPQPTSNGILWVQGEEGRQGVHGGGRKFRDAHGQRRQCVLYQIG